MHLITDIVSFVFLFLRLISRSTQSEQQDIINKEVLIDGEIDLYLSRHNPVSSAAAQLSEKPIVTKIGRKFCVQFLRTPFLLTKIASFYSFLRQPVLFLRS